MIIFTAVLSKLLLLQDKIHSLRCYAMVGLMRDTGAFYLLDIRGIKLVALKKSKIQMEKWPRFMESCKTDGNEEWSGQEQAQSFMMPWILQRFNFTLLLQVPLPLHIQISDNSVQHRRKARIWYLSRWHGSHAILGCWISLNVIHPNFGYKVPVGGY